MICAQVVGNDAAILVAAQSGSFQLNTILPLIAWNLLSSIQLLTEAARSLGPKAIAGFSVTATRMKELAGKNPILATALAPRIGYDLSAAIAREALETGRSVADVAFKRTSLTEQELRELLDPARMTRNEISC